LIGVVAALLVSWLPLVVALAVKRPRGGLLTESLRLLPDLLRMLRRLTVNRELPTGVRVRVAMLAVYLAMPIDLIPDFVPIIGYADDAIVVVVLRSVCRRVSIDDLRNAWPGTDDGFAALLRLVRPPTSLEDSHSSGAEQRPVDIRPACPVPALVSAASRRMTSVGAAATMTPVRWAESLPQSAIRYHLVAGDVLTIGKFSA
jgi:uncharacterized membrane protein YkvA (DUF1232 family)